MTGVRPQAVLFDWGGTLTPWHSVDPAEQWRIYAQQFTAEPERAEALSAAIMAAERRAWAQARVDGRSARLAEVLAEAGITPDAPGHPSAQVAYEEFWEPHTITDPEVVPLLTGLRERGLRVGVLSNTIWSREYHERIFERDGVAGLFDGAVYSCEIPWVKPHREAFRAAMAAVGVDDPAACVYVGDRPYEDVHGAQQAGMRAVFVPHSQLPLEQQVPVDVEPDAVSQRLLDVLDIVDAWLAG